MKLKRIGLQTALVATLLASGLAVSSCRDDHPGRDSDRHGGERDRGSDHDSGHDQDRSHRN